MVFGIPVAVLIIAIIVLASVVIRPESYQGVVAEKVRGITGRTLSIDGGTSLRFFPWLGLEAEDVSFGNAEGFGPEPMLKVASMEFRVRLLPLFSGRIEVSRVRLQGVDVLLEKNERGVSNWDDLAEGTGGKEKQAQSSQPSLPSTGKDSFSLAVQGLTFDAVNLTYHDRPSGARYVVKNGDIEITDFELGRPFDCVMKALVEVGKPAISGTVDLSGKVKVDIGRSLYSVSALKGKLDLAGKVFPGEALDCSVSAGGIVADLKSQILKAEALAVSAYDATVKAELSVSGLLKAPAVNTTLSIEPVDLRSMLSMLGVAVPETADETVLTRASGTMNLAYAPDTVTVSRMDLTLDDSSIKGNATFDNFSRLSSMVRVQVDEVDLDRYLPPRKSAEEKTSTSSDTSGGNAGETTREKGLIPVDFIRSLDVDAQLSVGSLKAKNLRFTDVRLNLNAKKGNLVVNPLSFKGYGGTVKHVLTVDASTDRPRSDVVAEVNAVQLGPLLRDLKGKESLHGTVNLRAALGTTGTLWNDMKKTLNGTGEFALRDGIFPGVDVSALARSAKGSKRKSGKIEAGSGDKTRFGSITGAAKVRNGLISSGNLEVMAPNLRAVGEGDVDLVQGKVDFLVKAKLVPSGKGQGGQSYEDTIGVPVPIHVGGSLRKPTYFVNVAEYIRMLGTGVVDTVGGVVKGVGGVVEGVGGLLQELIPGKKKQPAGQ